MHAIRTLAHAAGFAGALFLSASAFGESTFALSQLARQSGAGGPSVNDYILDPAGPVVRSISDPPNGSASSFGQAGLGVLKASATAKADGLPYGRFSARSAVGFSDDLTFRSLGLDGASGFMNATLVFERTLSVEGNAVDGYATASLHAGTNFWSYDYMETYMLQPSGCNPYQPGGPACALSLTALTGNGADSATWLDAVSVSLRVPITFGTVNTFSASIDMTALATFYSPGPGVDGVNTWMADAAHSFYWGGISSVTDATGNAVDFTLTAASGTDYLQSFVPDVAPIPEPETYALMLGGLTALGLFGRRQRRVGDRYCARKKKAADVGGAGSTYQAMTSAAHSVAATPGTAQLAPRGRE